MPIRVREGLPAIETLANENIFIVGENRANHQDMRTLKILIVNLMPKKIATETQLLRLLSNTSLQLSVEFLKMSTHESKQSASDHMLEFYKTFDEIKNNSYDGIIITGATIEQLKFEKVDYWNELCIILEWAKLHVYASLYICWGAQAALHYHFGIEKYNLPLKLSGIYLHTVNRCEHPMVRGFDDSFMAPHSRYTYISKEQILEIPELDILAESEKAGVYLVADKSNRHLFVTGHCEYDRDTLKAEYIRDFIKGKNPNAPENYVLKENANFIPHTSWCSHASLLFSNWLNYYVYQQTPYDLEELTHTKNK